MAQKPDTPPSADDFPGYREIFRRQTHALFAAFDAAAPGFPVSVLARIASGNRQYLHTIAHHAPTVTTHDRVLENFSAIWPEDTPWPDDVPRPRPGKAPYSQLSEADRIDVAARIDEARARAAEQAEKGQNDG